MLLAKSRLILLVGMLILTMACLPGVSITIGETPTPLVITATLPAPTATNTPVPPTLALSPIPPTPANPSSGIDHVNIYLVAVGDNGVSGKLIGCGDSLVPVEVSIPPTLGVLRAALNELFALEGEQYYGQSGLYNALYQSDLSIADAAVEDGEAIIRLKGNLLLGGECDIPRVEEQLKALALQFSTVDRVSVYINGERLEKLLDLRG
jgi:hypothetical protein